MMHRILAEVKRKAYKKLYVNLIDIPPPAGILEYLFPRAPVRAPGKAGVFHGPGHNILCFDKNSLSVPRGARSVQFRTVPSTEVRRDPKKGPCFSPQPAEIGADSASCAFWRDSGRSPKYRWTSPAPCPIICPCAFHVQHTSH